MAAMMPSEFLSHRRQALQQAYEVLALNVAEADKALAALAGSGSSHNAGAVAPSRPEPHPSADASQRQDAQSEARKVDHAAEAAGHASSGDARPPSSAVAASTGGSANSMVGGSRARVAPESAPPPLVALPDHAPQLYSLAMQLRGLYLQRATVRRGLQQLYSSHFRMQIADGRTVQRALTPRLPEPTRRRAHPDAVLEEMQWLATDMYQERRWKIAMAKILAREAAQVVHAEGSPWRKRGGEAGAGKKAAVPVDGEVTGMLESSPLLRQARARSVAVESMLSRVMRAGDVPATPPYSNKGEERVETAMLRTVPYAAVAKEATASLGPVWDTLRRAAFALCATCPSAWATFPLLHQREKREGLLAFRPLGTGSTAAESFNGLPFALGSQSLIVLASALAGAAHAWVADGQGALEAAVAHVQAEEASSSPAGSVVAVMDATSRGKPILRAPQLKVAQRIVCSWLAGSPAILEGFTTSRGLGRTSTAAAAIAAMHARHRATESSKAAVSLVVCAGVSLHAWCAALTRFAPGLTLLPLASASAAEDVATDLQALGPGEGAVIVYALHDIGSLSSLPRMVSSVVSLSVGRTSPPPALAFLTCTCDHRAMRVAQQGSSSTSSPVSVQGVTSILAETLPAALYPSISRCVMTTPVEELPKDDPVYLAHLSTFCLPLQQGQAREGRHALDSVRRLAILSERTSALSAAGGPSGGGSGDGSALAGSSSTPGSSSNAMDVDTVPAGTEGPLSSIAMSEYEMDACVRGAMNRALWLLYVVVPGESEVAGEGGAAGGPGGSSPIAVPTTSIPGSGQFGAPDRQERTILAVHSIAQSSAQTRIVRCSQVRALQAGDVTGLYVTYLLASTYRFPLAQVKPEIHSKLYKGPAIDVEWPFVPLPGLPSSHASDGGTGAPTLPSQTSPQCLRLLAALSAACQHATPWLGLRANSRPDYACAHPLLSGEWYGAVNSVMPRIAVHSLEGGRCMKVGTGKGKGAAAGGTGLKAVRIRVQDVYAPPVTSTTMAGLPGGPPTPAHAWLAALASVHAAAIQGLGNGGQCIVGTACVERWERRDGGAKVGAAGAGAGSASAAKKGSGVQSSTATAPSNEMEAQPSTFSLRCTVRFHLLPMHVHDVSGGVGGRKCVRTSVTQGASGRERNPLPQPTKCNLHVQGAHSPSVLAMGTVVSRLSSARDAWAWLGMVGHSPVLQAVQQGGEGQRYDGPRIWPAEQPKEAAMRGVAHRMLLRSGKLRVLSSILSECTALGHVPLILGHTGEAVHAAQTYLDACGIPFVRLDAGTAESTGLWPAEAAARFTALAGARRGLVGLACCAAPSWVHKLDEPKSVTLALEAVLGAAGRLHPSVVDTAVVLDYPPSLQAGTLLETLLSKLRYGRALPVTRMRAQVSLEVVMLTGAVEVMVRGAVLDHTDRAIITRVLQPFLAYSESEIEECTEALLVQEAHGRLAGAQGAEAVLQQAIAQRMADCAATVRSACTPIGACPRDRHLSSPVGQGMVRRYAARKSMEAAGGVYTYDVPGHAGGDAQEDAVYDADVRSFGAIECNSGRHIYAPAIRPPPLTKHRHLQRRHAASIRAAIDVLARHQDEGGLHFSHAYGPPNPHERKVHRPPGTHADRGASETARHVARVTMDVIPGDITILHGAKAAQHPVPLSAMNAPAPPMPWRTSNAARRSLQLQVQAEKERSAAANQAGGARLGVGSGGASAGTGAGGAAVLASVGPIPVVPSVAALTRMYTWTRLTTRAMYAADMPFIASSINVTGETTSSMVTYAGPAPIQTTQDQVRRLLPSTLWDDMRFINETLGRSGAERRGKYTCKCPSGSEGVQDFEYSMEPLEPEASADMQMLHKSITANWERYSTGIRVRAGDLVLRPLADQAGILSLARKRFRVLIQGGDEGMQSVKRAKLALCLPGEATHASEVLRIGVRDASDDGAGSIVNANPGMPWTPAEDLALLRAVAQYGNNWSLIQEAMRGSSVSHLLPATMSYNYSMTLVTQQAAQAQAQGQGQGRPKYQFVPQISPLSNNRTKTTRSVRALFSRFRLWVHRPVHVAATVTLPAPPSLGTSASHGYNTKTTERSVVVRVLPGAQGSWKERSSMEVVPVGGFVRAVGADQLLSLHIRGPHGQGKGEDSLSIGIGQPVKAIVKDLSASDATLDAPAKRVTVSNLSKSVQAALMKANDTDPADLLTREAPKQHPQQRHFVPTTDMAKAVDPEVSLVLVNARSLPSGDASLLAATQSNAAMTRAPSVVAAHAPPHQAAMVAANVSSIVARKDWQDLSVNSYVHKFAERAPAGPGLGLPPATAAGDVVLGAPASLGPVKPVGAPGVLVPPVPAAFNVHSISAQQAIQPYKAKGAWLTSIGPYAHMLGQAQAAAAQAAAVAAGAVQSQGAVAAAPRRPAPTSAEYISAQFDALARKYLMSLKEVLAQVYSKRGMDYLPWLSYILQHEDKSTIVAAYSNLELDESKRIDIVTDLIVERTKEMEAREGGHGGRPGK